MAHKFLHMFVNAVDNDLPLMWANRFGLTSAPDELTRAAPTCRSRWTWAMHDVVGLERFAQYLLNINTTVSVREVERLSQSDRMKMLGPSSSAWPSTWPFALRP